LKREKVNLKDISKWAFFGVLVSIMDQSKQQRLFGVTVQGRASVINYWGDNLRPLDCLYLEKRTFGEDDSSFAPNGGKNNLKAKNATGNNPNLTHVLATTNPTGECVEIGFVGVRPHRNAVSQQHLNKCCQVLSLSNKLKRIEIFLRR
jgi:hypothetical protein